MTAAFALAGIAFYTLLVPWHLTSQFAAQLFAAEFGTDAVLICSIAPSTAPGPALPGAPTTNCPICKGLAAFHFALTPAPQVLAAAPPGRAPLFIAVREDVAGAVLPLPRSRGPPLPA